jgi:hypothetical protein
MSVKKWLKKRKIERKNLRNMHTDVEGLIRKNALLQLAITSSQSLVSTSNRQQGNELIVSFTTYSKRIHDVHLVIESIGQQTYKADRIILWLDETEFSESTIPLILKQQMRRGLEVRFCENLRSYKKLFPTLSTEPQSDVITIDDDFLYPHDFIELLMAEAQTNPDTVIGIRSHTMRLENGQLLPYKQWTFESSHIDNGPFTFLTTGAGTLFPAGLLPTEMADSSLYLDLSPSADDVWINLMCVKAGIKRIKIADDRNFKQRFLELPQNQDIALNASNVHQSNNDKQIQQIVEYFKMDLANQCKEK